MIKLFVIILTFWLRPMQHTSPLMQWLSENTTQALSWQPNRALSLLMKTHWQRKSRIRITSKEPPPPKTNANKTGEKLKLAANSSFKEYQMLQSIPGSKLEKHRLHKSRPSCIPASLCFWSSWQRVWLAEQTVWKSHGSPSCSLQHNFTLFHSGKGEPSLWNELRSDLIWETKKIQSPSSNRGTEKVLSSARVRCI